MHQPSRRNAAARLAILAITFVLAGTAQAAGRVVATPAVDHGAPVRARDLAVEARSEAGASVPAPAEALVDATVDE